MTLMLTLITNMALASLLVFITFWLPQWNIHTEETNPYECGFDLMGSAHLPFSMKFFLVAIMFLLFDLEIALLPPTLSISNNLKTMLIMALFLILLLAMSLA